MEGYIRLLCSIPVLLLAGLFFSAKSTSMERDGLLAFENGLGLDLELLFSRFEPLRWPTKWMLKSTLEFVSDLQSRIRQSLTILAAALIVLIALYYYYNTVRSLPIWPELVLVGVESGWHVLALLAVIVIKLGGCLIALLIVAIPFIFVGTLALYLFTNVFYFYLVFGSLLHLIFFFNFVMTGNYFAGLEPSQIQVVLILTTINLVLSDTIDWAIFIVDMTITSVEH